MPFAFISSLTNLAIAYKLVMDALRKSPYVDKENVPTGKLYIVYDEAIALVAERMPTDSKHRKSRATTAIAGLVGKGFLGMKGDWLWSI